MTKLQQTLTTPSHSPAPWSCVYSPYSVRHGDDVERELAAFEVFDVNGEKVFDTDEDSPAELQEANAQLAVWFPEMLAILMRIVALDDAGVAINRDSVDRLKLVQRDVRELVHRVNAI